jgi:hypothetical protein
MRTYVKLSDLIQLDPAVEGGSIAAWMSATTSTRKRDNRTSTGTTWWSQKLKTCFGDPSRTDRDGKDHGSHWEGPTPVGICASSTCLTRSRIRCSLSQRTSLGPKR